MPAGMKTLLGKQEQQNLYSFEMKSNIARCVWGAFGNKNKAASRDYYGGSTARQAYLAIIFSYAA